MKAAYESLAATGTTSFVVRRFEEKKFSAPYHFHPEYELTLITSGRGKRYVGTHMNDFYPGDFVLLGANLPHCWKTEQPLLKEKSGSVVVQFQKDFLGSHFFEKPELRSIAQLLNKSKYGVQFTGKTEGLKKKMTDLINLKDSFTKLLLLLTVLYELSIIRSYKLLDKQSARSELPAAEQQRIHTAIAYIVEHFNNNISLVQAASSINMTPHAFCKYFKRLTRKTFMEAVTDYRIDYAVKQLINTDAPVAEVGFDSGFNDISNFHKTFKARMNISPLNYRNAFMQKLG